MKSISMPVATLCAALLTGCSTIKETHQMQLQTLEGVTSTRADITKLMKIETERQQAELDKNKEDPRLTELKNMLDDRVASYTNVEQFCGITLGENPSEADIREYISAILATSKNQSSYGSSDLQVQLLVKLGNKQLPLLIEMMQRCASDNNYRARYHLKYAIQQLAGPADRDAIIAAAQSLPDNVQGDLLDTINKMKWENEAKDLLAKIITEKINPTTGSSYIDNNIITMLVRLNDPELNPLLFEAVAKSSNFSYNYGQLKNMEGFNAKAIMDTAWKYRLAQSSQDQLYVAQYAVEEGDLIALDMLISALTPTPRLRINFDPRFAVLSAIDFHGSNEEIQTWYEQNKNNLSFNAETKRFSVKSTLTEKPTK